MARIVKSLSILLLFYACHSEEPVCEVRVIREALTNATTKSEYLRLDPWEEAAVVAIQLQSDTKGKEARCSGVLVSDRLVITAKHCVSIENPDDIRILFGLRTDKAIFETVASDLATHPDADIMVLKLAASPTPTLDVVPIPPARGLPSGFAQGSLAQLAGFGLDEAQLSGSLGFLVEPVTKITDDAIVVGSQGLGGACAGDSGGPLFARADDGRVYVLGILRSGSAGCYGNDSYTRIDTLDSWLTTHIDEDDTDTTIEKSSHDAENLGNEGRCFDNKAVWFDGSRLRAEVCNKNRVCGWSESVNGYRCLSKESDPCDGVTDIGICDEGVALHCVRGEIESNPCELCGFACARSTKSGFPVCLAPLEPGKDSTP